MPIAAMATAAAVLVAVVAVAPALNLIGGGDSSDDTTILAEEAPSTTAAPAPGFDSTADATIPAGGAEEGAAITQAPLAATSTLVPLSGVGPELLAYFADTPNLDALRFTLGEDNYDEERARDFALKSAARSVRTADDGAADACLAVTLTNSEEFVTGFEFARGDFDGRVTIFYVLIAEDLAESAVVVLAADNCDELDRAGP